AVGDVDGDGLKDIITSPGPGGGPLVKVYRGRTLTLLASFYAYNPAFRGGARVAALDVIGDGRAEVVTGAGPGGGPHVRALRAAGGFAMSVLAGKLALITGASRGLGRQVALDYAAAGAARLALVARDAGRLAAVRAELAASAPDTQVLTVAADLGRADEVE